VTSVSTALVSFSNGVSEDTNIAPVITSDDKVSSLVSCNSVDVSTISALGVDTINVPEELNSLGSPHLSFGVRSSTGVLFNRTILGNCPEEELVSTTVRSEVGTILRPVEGHDVRRVFTTTS